MAGTFKAEGIVFRSLNYSETSLILDIYTREHGLDSYIVSGVRKSRSKIANVYHPMNIIDLVAYANSSGLKRIREGRYAVPFSSINFDVLKSALGMFMIDLARQSIQEKEANEELYVFLKESLTELDKGNLELSRLPIQFAIQLASYLGFGIQNNRSDTKPYFDLMTGQFIDNDIRNPHILNEALSKDIGAMIENKSTELLTRDRRNLILDHLITYYKLHIENFKDLKSLPVLRAILS